MVLDDSISCHGLIAHARVTVSGPTEQAVKAARDELEIITVRDLRSVARAFSYVTFSEIFLYHTPICKNYKNRPGMLPYNWLLETQTLNRRSLQ